MMSASSQLQPWHHAAALCILLQPSCVELGVFALLPPMSCFRIFSTSSSHVFIMGYLGLVLKMKHSFLADFQAATNTGKICVSRYVLGTEVNLREVQKGKSHEFPISIGEPGEVPESCWGLWPGAGS